MLSSLLLATAVCWSTHTTVAAREADLIQWLPGYADALPSKMYSGYIDIANSTRHLHYWFIECEQSPETAAVTLWLNGGPGASSLFGLLVELGPFIVNDDSLSPNSTGVPHLLYNPHGWQRVSNMLFVEQPAGVGFSYCDGDAGPVDSCPDWDDELMGRDMAEFLSTFFGQAFPEYSKNDFYMTGESYAGVYIPVIAKEIMDNPGLGVNLKGFAIGNGCNGLGNVGACGVDSLANFVQYAHGHGLFEDDLYWEILDVCGWEGLSSDAYKHNERCLSLITTMRNQTGGFNVYNVYDPCYLLNDNVAAGANEHELPWEEWLRGPAMRRARNGARGGAAAVGTDSLGYKCGGQSAMHQWLTLPQTPAVLHVKDIPWVDQDGWDKYTCTQKDLTPLYPSFISKYRVLIYSGDFDAGVPYLGSEKWASKLGIPRIERWRPWTIDGKAQMGGYVTRYDSNFTFLTVRGAGHMVPQTKPAEALEMITRFLRGENWQYFDGSDLHPPY